MLQEKSKSIENQDQVSNIVKNLILFNDDIHSFDYVIDSLVKVCKHNLEQAEQCTLIVHYKGKCAIKSGTQKQLNPMGVRLSKLGLSTTIE